MRRRRVREGLPTLATHFPSLSHASDMNPNIHMFTQDVQLAVMPIGGRAHKNKDFTVDLMGSDEDKEKSKQLLSEIGQNDRIDLAEIVCDAINEIAQRLAWDGCAVFEIVRGDHGSQHICGITTKRLFKLPMSYLQVIPRGDWGLWKKKAVVIPASRVWDLEMPPALGGRKGYRSVLKRLKRFEHLGPEFWKKDLEYGVQSREFDFQSYVRNCEIYYGQVTKSWGWNRRDWSQQRCTEFYTFYKMMRFQKSQALLREHIVVELNGLLKRLGISCKLQVTGLPTPQDVLKTEREMTEGRITFGAASDRVRL